MAMAVFGVQDPTAFQTLSPKIQKKLNKLKVNEIIDMQELMLDELKKFTKELEEALKKGAEDRELNSGFFGSGKEDSKEFVLKDHLCVPLVQSMATMGVYKRYQITGEEMSMAGYIKAPILATNERFLQVTYMQQQVMMSIPEMLKEKEKACCIM